MSSSTLIASVYCSTKSGNSNKMHFNVSHIFFYQIESFHSHEDFFFQLKRASYVIYSKHGYKNRTTVDKVIIVKDLSPYASLRCWFSLFFSYSWKWSNCLQRIGLKKRHKSAIFLHIHSVLVMLICCLSLCFGHFKVFLLITCTLSSTRETSMDTIDTRIDFYTVIYYTRQDFYFKYDFFQMLLMRSENN